MPIIVGCPGCSGRLRIADHLLGGKVRCPACNKIFQADKQPVIEEERNDPSSDPSLPQLEFQNQAPLPDPDRALELALGKPSDPKDPSDRGNPEPPENSQSPEPQNDSSSEKQDEEADEAFRDCSECGKKMHRGTRRCIHCGYRIGKRRRRDYEEEEYEDEEDDDYGRPRYRNDWVPHRGGLVLALGIVSIATIFICWPLAPLALIPGIIAWVLGRGDLNRIRSGEMDPAGESTTQAGWICGMVGTGINTLAILGCGAFIGFATFAESQRQNNPKPNVPFNPPPIQQKQKIPKDMFDLPGMDD